MVTNNGTKPIYLVSLGGGEDTFIEVSFEAVPTNVGSPGGWNGEHVFGHDPQRPEAHSPTLISYLWDTEDPKARIQPGQSLSGFSVQLPAPRKDLPDEERRPAHPDLTDAPFQVYAYGARCPAIGTVELE